MGSNRTHSPASLSLCAVQLRVKIQVLHLVVPCSFFFFLAYFMRKTGLLHTVLEVKEYKARNSQIWDCNCQKEKYWKFKVKAKL